MSTDLVVVCRKELCREELITNLLGDAITIGLSDAEVSHSRIPVVRDNHVEYIDLQFLTPGMRVYGSVPVECRYEMRQWDDPTWDAIVSAETSRGDKITVSTWQIADVQKRLRQIDATGEPAPLRETTHADYLRTNADLSEYSVGDAKHAFLVPVTDLNDKMLVATRVTGYSPIGYAYYGQLGAGWKVVSTDKEGELVETRWGSLSPKDFVVVIQPKNKRWFSVVTKSELTNEMLVSAKVDFTWPRKRVLYRPKDLMSSSVVDVWDGRDWKSQNWNDVANSGRIKALA